MAPVATNCDTDVRVHCQRTACGRVRTQVTAQASLLTRSEYVRVEIDAENRWISVEHGNTSEQTRWWHSIPWSAFCEEPTLGKMIEAAEAVARGEWFKLFPEEDA